MYLSQNEENCVNFLPEIADLSSESSLDN